MLQNACMAFDARLIQLSYARNNDQFPNGECGDIWGWDLGAVDGLNETIGTYYGIYNKNYRKDHCSQTWMCKGNADCWGNKLFYDGEISLIEYELLICIANKDWKRVLI